MVESKVPQTHVYKRVGSLELKADVYGVQPQEARAHPRPVVLWMHGGALVLGTRKDLGRTRARQLAMYVDEGWIVASIDYRLAPESHLGLIWEDVSDAFGWMRGAGASLFAADPERAAAVGASAGGYLALLAGAKLEPPPRAVVSFFGYGDILGEWYTRPDPFYIRMPSVSRDAAMASVGTEAVAELPESHQRREFYLYLRQQGLWPRLVGGPEDLAEYCPERLVASTYPPTLLMHGDADTDVPFRQSLQMASALATAAIEHEVMIVTGASHSFDRQTDAPGSREALDAVRAFLRRHLTSETPSVADRPSSELVVFNGTVMRGQPAHANLRGATFIRTVRTAPRYRLYSIGDRFPVMVRDESAGVSVEAELYHVPADVWPTIRDSEPKGLHRGPVELDDGSWVEGMLGDPEVVLSGNEITTYRGWRPYLQRTRDPGSAPD